MIGIFDTGHGGLTILRALTARFPDLKFVYLGDHANAPYGNRSADDVIERTQANVEVLFGLGCRLVILACNTATAVACRQMQRVWLPDAGWSGHNVLGIVAPTVEAATQTPWAQQTPVYPQKYNRATVAIFGTRRTIASGVYEDEIRKRCPLVQVVAQPCPSLAGAIEAHETDDELDVRVRDYVAGLMAQLGGDAPDTAILGCTHYPLVEQFFSRHLPATTRILAQPEAVAHSLEDYLARHPHYAAPLGASDLPMLLTTGDAERIDAAVRISMPQFIPDGARFTPLHAVADRQPV